MPKSLRSAFDLRVLGDDEPLDRRILEMSLLTAIGVGGRVVVVVVVVVARADTRRLGSTVFYSAFLETVNK